MGTPIPAKTMERDMRSTTAATSLAMVVDAAGVRPLTSDADGQDVATTFCWVDVFGGEDSERKTLLTELGLDDAELAAAVRLGQAGRMVVGRRRLRAVTWLAEPSGQLIEIHLLCSQRGIVTVWRGNPSALDDVRQHFAERIGGVEKSPYQAASVPIPKFAHPCGDL